MKLSRKTKKLIKKIQKENQKYLRQKCFLNGHELITLPDGKLTCKCCGLYKDELFKTRFDL